MEPFKVFAIKDYSPQKDYEIMLQAGKIYTVDKQEENSYQVVSEGGRCGWAPSDNFYLLKTVEKNKSVKSCNLCNKTIEEDYITSDEKDYHTKCFECAGCKKILIGLPYINNNDNIFCESCSKENDKICADCNEKISGTYVTALDKYFHPEHFVCSHCKKQFTETYHTIMGKALCSDCFNAQTNNVCEKCGIKMGKDDEQVKIAGMCVHLECFVCEYGKEKLNIDQTIKISSKKLYCEQHFLNNVVKRCYSCEKALLEHYVTVLKRQYHPSCLNCEQCNINLAESTPVSVSDKLFCKKHGEEAALRNKRLQKEKNEAARKKLEEENKRLREEAIKAEEEKKRAIEAENARIAAIEEKKQREERLKKEELKKSEVVLSEYTLEEVRETKANFKLPLNFNKSRKEEYLAPEVFQGLFMMTLSEFKKYPLWRQRLLKTRHDLM